MKLDKRQEEWLIGGALVLLLAWALYHFFHRQSNASTTPVESGPTIVSAAPIAQTSFPTFSNQSPGDCGCGGQPQNCSLSTTQIPSYQQILNAGVAATNQILAAGNATMEKLASMANNPFLTIHYQTVG